MLHGRLLEKLTEAKKELEALVSQGGANNYEHYRFLIGRIQGLKDAIDIIKDIFKRGVDEE